PAGLDFARFLSSLPLPDEDLVRVRPAAYCEHRAVRGNGERRSHVARDLLLEQLGAGRYFLDAQFAVAIPREQELTIRRHRQSVHPSEWLPLDSPSYFPSLQVEPRGGHAPARLVGIMYRATHSETITVAGQGQSSPARDEAAGVDFAHHSAGPRVPQ